MMAVSIFSFTAISLSSRHMLRSAGDIFGSDLRFAVDHGAANGEGALDFIVLLLNLPHRIDPKCATTLLDLAVDALHHGVRLHRAIPRRSGQWHPLPICKLVPVAAASASSRSRDVSCSVRRRNCSLSRLSSPVGGLFFLILITRRGMWSS